MERDDYERMKRTVTAPELQPLFATAVRKRRGEMRRHGMGISSTRSTRVLKTVSENLGHKEVDDLLALIGTDDEYWTKMVSPALTVISQPVRQIGKLAGECLLARASGEFEAGQTIVLNPSLIVRAST